MSLKSWTEIWWDDWKGECSVDRNPFYSYRIEKECRKGYKRVCKSGREGETKDAFLEKAWKWNDPKKYMKDTVEIIQIQNNNYCGVNKFWKHVRISNILKVF